MSSTRNQRRPELAALACAAILLAACPGQPKSTPGAATTATFTRGMVLYLKARGDLCLGKEFPIDVSEREFQTGSRNALQMPALEHAGLVSSTDALGTITTDSGSEQVLVRRYRLTDAGMRCTLSRPILGAPANGEKPAEHSDLCALRLSLGKVVSFELSPPAQPTSALVSYTYKVEPAPWLSSPEIQQVFPAVTRVLVGAGTAELQEGFTLTPAGWLANELLPGSASAGPVANR